MTSKEQTLSKQEYATFLNQRAELLGIHRVSSKSAPKSSSQPRTGPVAAELPPPLTLQRSKVATTSLAASRLTKSSDSAEESDQSSTTTDLDALLSKLNSIGLSEPVESSSDCQPPPIPTSRSVYHKSPTESVRSTVETLVQRKEPPRSPLQKTPSLVLSEPSPKTKKDKAKRRVKLFNTKSKKSTNLEASEPLKPKTLQSSPPSDAKQKITADITSAVFNSINSSQLSSSPSRPSTPSPTMDANYNTNMSNSQIGMAASDLVPDDPTYNVQAAYPEVIEGLKKIYKEKILPVEERYKFDEFHSPLLRTCDFDSKPMVLLLGQYSVGKTSFIEYLLERPFPGQRIGPEPTTDKFIAVTYGDTDRVIPGAAVSVDANKPFSGLNKFGTGFLSKFEAAECKANILEKIMFVDTPGVLSGEKQRIGRSYDFISVIEWFAERADMILLLFDAHKLDISDEFKLAIGALRGHDDKIRVVLNKADSVSTQQLMRVYGALMWSLGKVVTTPEVMKVYIGSFWNQPLRYKDCAKLFEVEQQDLIRDLRQLPRNSAVRKVNELVKRARLVKVHAYIISHLKEQMPMLFGKESKKEELIKNLYNEFCVIERKWRLPPGDFPTIERFQYALKLQDFDKFSKFSQSLVPKLDEVLGNDLPRLMVKLSPPKTEEEKNPFANPPPTDWVISGDKATFDDIFFKINPEGGKLSGAQAKQVLMETGVKTELLRKIWSLSDMDKDGFLDHDEFAVAMYLTVEVRKQGLDDLPDKLPKDWVPPSKRALLH